MPGAFLVLQAFAYFTALGVAFPRRQVLGFGVFFCMLWATHFLETYLAAVSVIHLPFGLIAPGSAILFSGKLAVLLLLYIKEDAQALRQPLCGLLASDMLMLLLSLLLRLDQARAGLPAASLPGYAYALHFLDRMGLLMTLGTALLCVDLFALARLYETLRAAITTRGLFGRIFCSLAVVLTFDQIGFYTGLHYLAHASPPALYGGWAVKMAAATLFSFMLTFYLRFVETGARVRPQGASGDVFDRLTYRRRYEKLVEQVGRDALTGLQDRGQFDAQGPASLAGCARSKLPLSLLVIDIDHFKRINDRHGHPVGDRVICSVVATILSVLRKQDALFRYGGEEFALLCQGLAHDEAAVIAERIRLAVASASHHPDLSQPVTISIGVASFPSHAADFFVLLARSDEALYLAKAVGRDKVCVQPSPQLPIFLETA